MQRAACFIFMLLLFVSCSKEDGDSGNDQNGEKPTVAFSFSINGYVAPSQVAFSNKSKNAGSFLWDFGDGVTSTEVSPAHTYTQAGSYQVKLTAYNSQSSATAGIVLDIQPPYTSCMVGKVILENAPFTNSSGNPLDSASGPDFKIKILNRNTGQVLASTGMAANVLPAQLPLSFSISPPYLFPAFNQEYDVLLYDDDAPDPDELVAGYFFKLSDATTISYHYPDTMLLFKSGETLRMNLVLEWGY